MALDIQREINCFSSSSLFWYLSSPLMTTNTFSPKKQIASEVSKFSKHKLKRASRPMCQRITPKSNKKNTPFFANTPTLFHHHHHHHHHHNNNNNNNNKYYLMTYRIYMNYNVLFAKNGVQKTSVGDWDTKV